MSLEADCCVLRDTFSNVCGHSTTVFERHATCTKPEGPLFTYDSENGQLRRINHNPLSIRWAGAQITESRCSLCEASGQNLPPVQIPQNTWISDFKNGNLETIESDEMELRKQFWKNYISDQTFLFQRQQNLLEDLNKAVKELQEYDEELEEARDAETRNNLSSNVTRAQEMYEICDLDQNLYLGRARSIYKLEMIRLFDPMNLTSLTCDLLHLVKPEEIPTGEICGICRDVLDGSDKVRRVFCRQHIFHQNCIVSWFDFSRGDTVSCPMCRKEHHIYRMDEWRLTPANNPQNGNHFVRDQAFIGRMREICYALIGFGMLAEPRQGGRGDVDPDGLELR